MTGLIGLSVEVFRLSLILWAWLWGRNHPLFNKLSPSIFKLSITKVSAEAAPMHLYLPTKRQLLQTPSVPPIPPLLPVWKAHLHPPAGPLPAAAVRPPLLPASASASQPAWPKHGSSALLAASPTLWTENQACSPVPFLLPWPSLSPVLTAFKGKNAKNCVKNSRNVVQSPRTTTGMWQLCSIHSDQPWDSHRSLALSMCYTPWMVSAQCNHKYLQLQALDLKLYKLLTADKFKLMVIILSLQKCKWDLKILGNGKSESLW